MLNRDQAFTCARWCGKPGYCHREPLAPAERIVFDRPVLDIFAANDPLVTDKTRADLDRYYRFENRSEIALGYGFGHVGFFHRRNEEYWSSIFDFLEK